MSQIISLVVMLTMLCVQCLSSAEKAAPEGVPATSAEQVLDKKYADMLKALQAEILKAVPKVDERKMVAHQKAREAVKKAESEAAAAQAPLNNIQTARALVDHAKGKWIGGAEKGIATAETALQKATSDAEKEAARKDLEKWKANKEDGIKALKERQAALDKAVIDESKAAQANQAAKEALAQAQAEVLRTSGALLEDVNAFLTSDKLDTQLVKCAVITAATPRGLAKFAQQGKEQEALVDRLLADNTLMRQMLEAGGAKFGMYGRAMEIYTAIQKASGKAKEGHLGRLALATSLEHAQPVAQSNPQDQTDLPTTVDPVKRYLHYEKAFLDGELDPAFQHFTAWEYRQVVDCDAPDHILAWGREMLRNYRPDHIYNPDYGWRYSGSVRTEVPYGSENVKCDLATLHNYQNIIKDGGVCGRRAFFGRFILQSFGIPVWGVTQHKHAAVSHWTPKGWLVNLGAGFSHSWWDKDEVPRSGLDFLLETQARAVPQDFQKVLRAQWVSSALGEQQYNDRKRIDGGLWSGIAHCQSKAIATATKAVDLGPLGQELGEANEAREKDKVEQAVVTEADRKIRITPDGVVTIPAGAYGKASGHSMVVKSFLGGTQLHCTGGFTAEYAFEVPMAGKYTASARVVTAQEGQKVQFAANDAKASAEIAVPYTIGKWQQAKLGELSLVSGKNMFRFTLQTGSRGVTIKEFILTPVK